MKLYTHQSPDFNIIKQKNDLNKSVLYKEHDVFRKTYDWLFSEIKTNKVIWCYPETYKPHVVHGMEVKQWTLEVPENEIITGIKRDDWDLLLLDFEYEGVSSRLLNQWFRIVQNLELTPDKEDEWLANTYKEWIKGKNVNELKKKNVLTKKYKRCYEFIIPSPIKKEWVVKTEHFSEYDTMFIEKFSPDIENKFGFSNFAEAELFCHQVKGYMKGKKQKFKMHCEGSKEIITVSIWLI